MPVGYVLQPTFRIEGERLVILLFGRLEDGRTFLVREGRFRPYFFIRTQDEEAAKRILPGIRVAPADLFTLAREPVLRVDVDLPARPAAMRDRLEGSGVPCFEADLRVTSRFLIDRGIRGGVRIEGPSRPGAGVAAVFEDPAILPHPCEPRLKILSLDIETSGDGKRLFSAACWWGDGGEVHMLGGRGERLDGGVRLHEDEPTLIRALFRTIHRVDPDIITGWNVIDFDLAFLEGKAGEHGIPFRFGRVDDDVRIRRGSGFGRESRAEVTGRQVVDGIALCRAAYVDLEDFKLSTAAREILGEEKRIGEKGKVAEIEAAFARDKRKLAAYNLADARLVTEILEKTGAAALALRRSLVTGLPLDRVGGSIAAFDALYLPELRRRGFVAPSVRGVEEGEGPVGGEVLPGQPGIYDNVLVFDFRSLYPSIIRTFNIDPLSYAPHWAADAGDWARGPGAGFIAAPNGAHFRREPGILPEIIARLADRRESARAAGDAAASQAFKILMNSFYGVLAAQTCRFYNLEVANAITQFGREILRWTQGEIQRLGYSVIYGDTDSIFVDPRIADPDEARRAGRAIASAVNAQLREWIEGRHRVRSRLDLEFQTQYRKFLLPELRTAGGGSKKRYAGIAIDEKGGERLRCTGLESVRRDWTPLAREFQRGLLDLLFRGGDVEGYIRATVADLRAGRLDDRLVYRKGVRKDLASYTKTTPPHVKAARMLDDFRGRIIEYVVTSAGPEPLARVEHPIDHEHYVWKQLGPVADSILGLLGKRFEDVLRDEEQLTLF
ncbi:MAG: DNA polymerase II [Planctomycetes bacterium]|nr:DNA polymerase II [Planctomycetota bacterium]